MGDVRRPRPPRSRWPPAGANAPLPELHEAPAAAEQPLVSVLTPTTGERHHLHPLLYRYFDWQTYPNKELVVLDSGSGGESPFFARLADSRVRYVHQAEAAGRPGPGGYQRWSIGAKRNALAELAAGEVLAQFDDDDLYAPSYLERMVAALGDRDLVTLGSWFNCVVSPDGYQVAFYDAASLGEMERWGFGFSYVMRRDLALQVRFEDVAYGEDYDFVRRAASVSQRRRAADVASYADAMGSAVVLHVSHAFNASKDHALLRIDDCDGPARRQDLWVPAGARVSARGAVDGILVLPSATFEAVLGPEAGYAAEMALCAFDWGDLARPSCALDAALDATPDEGA